MPSVRARWKSTCQRYGISWRSWHGPAALVTIIVLVFAWWVIPGRIDAVVSVDAQQRWKTREAPPRREIVWKEPQAVAPESAPEGAMISPRLADGGNTLYFTCRVGGGQTDIFRTRRVDGHWQQPEPMTKWNTASDDIGPTFSDDGRTAYLYSNRPGGEGGFDLYFAERENSDWSAPQNLGATVNSPAQEYDPAPGPDGQLFFTSNCKLEEDARPTGKRSGRKSDGVPWVATLRAHPGPSQYDLFVTSRASAGENWSIPRPLNDLNDPEWNEGAPFSSGGFLYFASDRPVDPNDRPVGDKEIPNLDLYRARWNGEKFVNPENLGRSINTPAHETEPGLSPEGYTLVFASNRKGTDDLYISTAQEVFHDVVWDDSNLRAVSAIWWKALLLTLLFASVIAVFFYSRGWLFEKASAARFVAISLLLHCLLLSLMALVPLATVVIEMAQEIRVQNPASQLFDNNQHQSHEDGLEAYERLADLKSVETQPLPEITRQETEPLNVPEMTTQPILNLPQNVVRNVPPDRIEFVPMAPVKPLDRVPTEIVRDTRIRAEALLAFEAEAAELLPAEPTPEETPAEQQAEELTRAVPAVQRPDADLPIRRTAPVRLEMLAEMEALDSEVAPVPEVSVKITARTAAVPKELPAAAPELAAVPEAIPAAEMQVREVEIAVSRAATDLVEPSRPSDPTHVTMPRTIPRSVEVARLDAGLAETLVEKMVAPEVNRVTQAQFPVETNTLAELPVVGAESPTELVISAASLQVERGAAESPATEVGAIPQQQQLPRQRLSELPAELARIETSAVRAEITASSESLLSRMAATTPEDTQAGAAKTEPVQSVESSSEELANPSAIAVAINRAAEDRPTVAKSVEVPTPAVIAARMPVDDATMFLDTADQPKAVVVLTVADVARSRATEEPQDDALSTPTLAAVVAEETSEMPVLQAAIEVERQAADAPVAGPETLEEIGGPHHHMEARLIVGALDSRRIDAPPSFSPIMTRLQRTSARAKQVTFAEDNVGMQAMFTLRQGDTRREFIELFGGTEVTETAVNTGLVWLATQQNEDGSWSLHTHEGSSNSNTAGTGFGLLPFLAAGHTTTTGQYQENVSRALKWLVDQQKPDGDLLAKTDNAAHHMYAHGVATIALCEGYGMSQDPALKEPTQRAINFIVAAQHQGSGGWRYKPNEQGDTSVVGWQVMALKSGEMAGLNVPPAALEGARRWLASVEGNQPVGGRFGYTDRGGSIAMTAEGLLCLQFLGLQRNDPRMKAGAEFLLNNLPKAGVDTSYYWYYGTQTMYHMQGKYWQAWNDATRDMLVNTQLKDGPNAGTWNPTDNWERSGGRIYSTSIRLLMLEVYYRHLPLYQQLDE